jgi:hypothetical protein
MHTQEFKFFGFETFFIFHCVIKTMCGKSTNKVDLLCVGLIIFYFLINTETSLIAELPIKLQIRQSTVAHGSNSSYYRG